MSKLLSANFIRLKKDKFFWSGLVFMLAAGIFFSGDEIYGYEADSDNQSY